MKRLGSSLVFLAVGVLLIYIAIGPVAFADMGRSFGFVVGALVRP